VKCNTKTQSCLCGKIQKNLVLQLKELRKIHGLTQEEFSERTGISYKYYQAIETQLPTMLHGGSVKMRPSGTLTNNAACTRGAFTIKIN
jgi:DNA-binding XRE family transcriptional regulator